MKHKLSYILLLLLICHATWVYVFKVPHHVLAEKDHQYIGSQVQRFAGYTMTNLEHYEGEFRIFSKKYYHLGNEAKISPLDLLVGWGAMANPEVYKKIKFSQSNRFGYWRTSHQPPLPLEQITNHTANMHMIAANVEVAKQLKKIKKDQLVFLKGHLVEINDDNGWRWRSSLSRTDTGNGACELMLVNEIKILS